MDAAMNVNAMRPWALLIVILAGCASTRQNGQSPPPSVARGTQDKPLAISVPPSAQPRQSYPDADPTLLIPPPPKLNELAADKSVEAAPTEPAAAKNAESDIKRVAASTVPPATRATLDRPATSTKIEGPAKNADDSLATMKSIYERAQGAYSKPAMDAFVARLTRRESLNGKVNPEEVISFMFRKQPYSVRLKWLGTEGQGREVIYVQGQNGNKMHVMPAKADVPFALLQGRMSFLPDDPMVRSKTRHDIREAGFGEAIRHLGNMLATIEKNPALRNRLRYLGARQRPEFQSQLDCIEETIPPRTENLLQDGGKRFTFFDTATDAKSYGLPVLVITLDANNKEVEYYRFDNFMYPYNLRDADFDPDRVWKK